MAHLRTELVSHAQRVCRLYKKAQRNVESYSLEITVRRIRAVEMRARFDEHKDEPDMRKAKQLVLDGEAELLNTLHPRQKKFAFSPGGIAYGRHLNAPDIVLDFWHPLEKAQYPDYFARREKRKEEYIKIWEERYGKPEAPHD